MKKYSITTTVNGKALVKQEHVFGTDGCKTSYGDLWAFMSLIEAAIWIELEMNPAKVIALTNINNFVESELAR